MNNTCQGRKKKKQQWALHNARRGGQLRFQKAWQHIMLNKASRNHTNILYSIRLPTHRYKISLSLHSMPHGLHMFRFMITLAIP